MKKQTRREWEMDRLRYNFRQVSANYRSMACHALERTPADHRMVDYYLGVANGYTEAAAELDYALGIRIRCDGPPPPEKPE